MSGFAKTDDAERIVETRVTGQEIVETLLQIGLLRNEDSDAEREAPPSLDTRVHRRFYAFRLDAFRVVQDYESSQPVTLKAQARNISTGGVSFAIDRAMSAGQLVRLDFAFPSQPVHYLIGSVRYCSPDKEGKDHLVGVAFVA